MHAKTLRAARAAAFVTAATLALASVAVPAAAAQRRHRVERGDTLADIAAAHGYRADDGWRVLYDANRNIEDPDLIEVGEVLRIPAKDRRPDRRRLPSGYGTPRRPAKAASRGSAAEAPSASTGSSVWHSLAACESGGDWSANTGNGYYGGLQFSLSSWRAVGGSGYPHEASPATQIAMGERLLAAQGWGAWPACASELGLR